MKRIQPQLLIAFTGIILIVLCMISFLLLVVLRQTSTSDARIYAELTTQAKLLSSLLMQNENLDDRLHAAFPIFDRVAERNQLRVALVNAEKRVLYDTQGEWNQPDVDLVSNLRKLDNGRYAGDIVWQNERWLAVAEPLLNAEDTLSHYLLIARFAPKVPAWQRFRDSLAKPIFQAGIIALILGIVLSILISQSIARPLKEVAQAATAIADGQYHARAPEKGPEEVRQTARAFNAMATKVQASQTAQKDLVANIAHDLRTPLTSIQGYAQALTDGTASTPETQAHAARIILEESQRLHQMTNALVDLARFEAGQINLTLTEFNLSDLITDRVHFYQNQAAENGIRLTGQLPADPLNVKVDAARITQVLDNLMSNALRYTSKDGRVVVAARQQNDHIEVSVADTGIGIPAEDLPRIFERFYRGDKSRQRGGTGLGLAIVREILRAHGGDITVESVVGVGTKFTFVL